MNADFGDPAEVGGGGRQGLQARGGAGSAVLARPLRAQGERRRRMGAWRAGVAWREGVAGRAGGAGGLGAGGDPERRGRARAAHARCIVLTENAVGFESGGGGAERVPPADGEADPLQVSAPAGRGRSGGGAGGGPALLGPARPRPRAPGPGSCRRARPGAPRRPAAGSRAPAAHLPAPSQLAPRPPRDAWALEGGPPSSSAAAA